METKNVSFRNSICARWLAVALSCLSLTVNAQSVPASSAFDRFMYQSTGAGKQTVGFSREGVPLVSPGVPTITPDGGLPRVDNSGSLPNPSGNRVPVGATGRIPAAEVGKAVGRALVKVAGPLAVGIAVYDLAKELGFNLSRDSSGGVGVSKDDPSVCTVSPCYSYRLVTSSPWFGDRSSAGVWWVGWQNASGSNQEWRFDSVQDTGGAGVGILFYSVRQKPAGAWTTNQQAWFSSQSASPATSVPQLPSTQQEFIDAVAAKSGWPSSSNVAKVLAQSGALDPSVKIQPDPLTVTGPATSAGKTSTTSNTTNNTTKTETTTHNHTYAGPVVTTTTVTVTNVTNTSTGDTINNETKTDTPDKAEEPPEDECKTYPDRIGCSDLDTPTDKVLKETKTVSYSEQNLFGSGSCPADLTASIGTLGQVVKVWDWQKTCDLALPLRALVLALASFAAAMIVMPGGGKS